MAGGGCNEEFKIAAVKQVTEGGYSVTDVAKRLGITTKSLYSWRDRYGKNAQAYQEKQSSSGELCKLKAKKLVVSMSRRGNCHDDSCAESFFVLLKRKRIRRKFYQSREEEADVFNYIELFYNPARRHGNNDLSPIEYEKNFF
jgi:Transposase and inactivated derivatives